MATEQRCDRETAEREFERFTQAMRLNRRLAKPRESDTQAALDNAKDSFIRAVQDGLIEVNEKGEAVFRPESDPDNPIPFHQPKGRTLMAADTKKDGQTMGKLFAQLSHMTGETTGRFADMPMYDLEIAQDIWLLFFG
jgi:hypothetical protein